MADANGVSLQAGGNEAAASPAEEKKNDASSEDLDPKKARLKKLFGTMKDTFMEENRAILDSYLRDNPNATTLEMMQYVSALKEARGDSSDSGPSLNCYFMFFLFILTVIGFRVYYNIEIEVLFGSLLYYALAPKTPVEYLINDLSWRTDCDQLKSDLPRYTNAISNIQSFDDSTITRVMDGLLRNCENLSWSINHKLLHLHEFHYSMYSKYDTLEAIINETIVESSVKYIRDYNVSRNALYFETNIDWIVTAQRRLIGVRNNIQNMKPITQIALPQIINELQSDGVAWLLLQRFINGLRTIDSINKEHAHFISDIVSQYEMVTKYPLTNNGYICFSKVDSSEIVVNRYSLSAIIADSALFNRLINADTPSICIALNSLSQISPISLLSQMVNWDPFIASMDGNTVKVSFPDSVLRAQSQLLANLESTKVEWLYVTKPQKYSTDASVIASFAQPKLEYFASIVDKLLCSEGIPLLPQSKLTGLDDSTLIWNYIYRLSKSEKSSENLVISELLREYSVAMAAQWLIVSQLKSVSVASIGRDSNLGMSIVSQISQQFTNVKEWESSVLKFIASNVVYFDDGYFWMYCNGQSSELYFDVSSRFDIPKWISTGHAVFVMDLFKDSYMRNAFIQPLLGKNKENNGRYLHIELLNNYLHSVITTLDWNVIAYRWKSQCVDTDSRKSEPLSSEPNNKRKQTKPATHNEL